MAVLLLLLVLAFDDNVPVPAAPEPEAAAAAVKGRFATFNDAKRDRSTSIAALSSGVGGIAVDEFAINSMIVSTNSLYPLVSSLSSVGVGGGAGRRAFRKSEAAMAKWREKSGAKQMAGRKLVRNRRDCS